MAKIMMDSGGVFVMLKVSHQSEITLHAFVSPKWWLLRYEVHMHHNINATVSFRNHLTLSIFRFHWTDKLTD